MLAASDVVVEVKLPQSLLVGSGLTRKETSDALLRSYIISLYRQDRVSAGKAANLLGVHRLTFIRMLAEEGIPYLDYTSEELEREIEAVEQRNCTAIPRR
jgi:predicted HTH domain antitoxin